MLAAPNPDTYDQQPYDSSFINDGPITQLDDSYNSSMLGSSVGGEGDEQEDGDEDGCKCQL